MKSTNTNTIETTNTICQWAISQQDNIVYNNLENLANKAFLYIVDCHEKKLYFSTIISNMPSELGYVLHPESFHMAWHLLIDLVPDEYKIQCIREIKEADDLNLYDQNTDNLTLTPSLDFEFKIALFEKRQNLIYEAPTFVLSSQPSTSGNPNNNTTSSIDNNDTTSSSDNTDSSYIVYTEQPQQNNWEFEFNEQSRKILLLALISFITIQLMAWYFKEKEKEKEKDTIDKKETLEGHITDDDTLNNIYEMAYFDFTLLYTLVLSFIPVSLLFIYYLRYYYYYKIKKLLKRNNVDKNH